MVKRIRLKKMINWSVQGPIVNRLLLHVLAYNAATLCLLMLVYGVRTSLAAITEQPTMTSPLTFWQQAAPVMVCMLIMVPYMVWDLMKLTNRIAGPLHRFESLLKDFIKSGTLNPANLRDGDLLTDFQAQFNEFAAALHAMHPNTKPGPISEQKPVAVVSDAQNSIPFRQSV